MSSSDDALALAASQPAMDDALYAAMLDAVGQQLAFRAVDSVWRVLVEQRGFCLAEVAHAIDYHAVLAYKRGAR